MKKILFAGLVCCLITTLCAVSDDFENAENATSNTYAALSNDGIKFYNRLRTCSPAKSAEIGGYIYGKTKTKQCRALLMLEDVQRDCTMPMQVAIGYATTALDSKDFAVSNPILAQERFEQNKQIVKVMINDYCKIK